MKHHAGFPVSEGLAEGPPAHAGCLLPDSNFPKEETYGLRGQMRRAPGSIGMNISEGCGRSGGC
ncbi:MAG: four helix bundle protein [Thermoanaerobaculia bacterium]